MSSELRLLVVEDDPVDRMAFERFVEDEGLPYDYYVATSIAEAREFLEREQPDIALMDYQLGDGTGLEVLEALDDVPALIVTGTGNERVAVEAMKRGAYDYLVKDPGGGHLTALPIIIDRTLIRFRAERELARHRDHLEEMVEERTAELVAISQNLHAEVDRRRETEEALRESQALLKQSQGIAHLGSWVLDVDTHKLSWSDEVYRMLGVNREIFEVTYEAFLDLIHMDDRAAVDRAYTESVREGRDDYEIEHRVVRADTGDVRIVHEKCDHVKDDSGRVIRSIGMVQDVTERRRREERIAHLNLVLRAIRDVNQLIVREQDRDRLLAGTCETLTETRGYIHAWAALYDEGGQLTTVSQAGFDGAIEGFVERLKAGERPACVRQAEAESGAVLIEQPVAVCDDCPLKEAYGGKAAMTVRLEHGERVYGFLSVSLPPDYALDEEEQALIEEIAGDIGFALHGIERERARERTETSLLEMTHRLQAFLDHSPALVSVFDSGGRYHMVNEATTRVLGRPADEIIGCRFSELVPIDVADVFMTRIHRLMESTIPVLRVDDRMEVDGEERVFETIIFPLSHDGDDLASFGSIATDVTERVEMEVQLRQQERLAAVGQLAGGIAHDFNNILAAIVLFAQMTLRDTALRPKTREALETILEESNRAAALIDQILDFSRSAMMETESESLLTVVEEGLALLRRIIPENIRLVTEMTSCPCIVEADSTRLHQALVNLVLNAKDAMPDGGELRIKVEQVAIEPGEEHHVAGSPAGRWATLIVSDTGTGMTEEVQAHLFEPFFTTKEQGKGTGLGLAQVYGIVMQHGGHIDVETAVGEGTTFTILLPLAEEGVEEAAPEEEQDAPEGRNETVLVVEDAEQLRKAVETGLKSVGYDVIAVANGREAMKAWPDHGVDLVLTDVVMPGMGGEALLGYVRARDPGLKVIAMTGHVIDTDVQDLLAGGFTAALHKPFSLEALTQLVREVLDA